MKRAILTAALLLAMPFSAHGVIGVDSDGNTTGAVVYAKETLSKSSTIEKDGGGTYYIVSESSRTGASQITRDARFLELDLWLPVPFSRGPSTSTVITLYLDNMVLARDIDVTQTGNLDVGEFEIRDISANAISSLQGLTNTLLCGGKRGDSSITVGVTTNSSTTIPTADHLSIQLRSLGILPDTPGTIRVTFSYEFAGQQISKTYEMRDAVKAMNLLEVAATPNDPIVDVDSDDLTLFLAGDNTDNDGKAANIGKVTTGAAMTYTAPDPNDNSSNPPRFAGNRVLAADGTWIVSPLRSVPTSRRTSGTLQSILGSTASVEIEGQTDFLGDDGKVFVSPNADCSPSRSSLVEDDAISAPLTSFAGNGGYVCIEVDRETTIPETMPYTATVKHESTTAAFPFPETAYELGSIGYGGSTVRIPFLTTNDSYNQRIVAVNRSERPASYTMTFQPSTDTDTVATPEAAATGTFPVGRTILLVRDVVTLEDGDHTAATLSIVAPPDKVDVATVLTNRNDGSTDSVVYDAE